jgi:hypothetical protein
MRGGRIGNRRGSGDRPSQDFCHSLSSASNKPPVYDVIPMSEMGLKARLKKHGLSRSNPRR